MKMTHQTRTVLWLIVLSACVLISGAGGWAAFVYSEVREAERVTKAKLDVLANAIREDGVCVRLETKRKLNGQTPFSLLVPSELGSAFPDTISEYYGQTLSGDTPLLLPRIPLDYPATVEISLLLRYELSAEELGTSAATDPHNPFLDTMHIESGLRSLFAGLLDTARIGKFVDEQLIYPPFTTIDFAIVDTSVGVTLFQRGQFDSQDGFSTVPGIPVYSSRLAGKPLAIYTEHPNAILVVARSHSVKLLIFVAALVVMCWLVLKAIRLAGSRQKLAQMQIDLVSNMTHELNTPIANIALALDTLKRAPTESSRISNDQLWDIIHVENRRLHATIKKVLEVSLLEGQQLVLQTEMHDLHVLLSSTAEAFRLAATRQGTRLELHLRAQKPWVKADGTYLANVLHALLDNAIKYAGDGAQVTLSTRDHDAGVLVDVTDTGPGIDKADRELVFEKFYRVRSGDQR